MSQYGKQRPRPQQADADNWQATKRAKRAPLVLSSNRDLRATQLCSLPGPVRTSLTSLESSFDAATMSKEGVVAVVSSGALFAWPAQRQHLCQQFDLGDLARSESVQTRAMSPLVTVVNSLVTVIARGGHFQHFSCEFAGRSDAGTRRKSQSQIFRLPLLDSDRVSCASHVCETLLLVGTESGRIFGVTVDVNGDDTDRVTEWTSLLMPKKPSPSLLSQLLSRRSKNDDVASLETPIDCVACRLTPDRQRAQAFVATRDSRLFVLVIALGDKHARLLTSTHLEHEDEDVCAPVRMVVTRGFLACSRLAATQDALSVRLMRAAADLSFESLEHFRLPLRQHTASPLLSLQEIRADAAQTQLLLVASGDPCALVAMWIDLTANRFAELRIPLASDGAAFLTASDQAGSAFVLTALHGLVQVKARHVRENAEVADAPLFAAATSLGSEEESLRTPDAQQLATLFRRFLRDGTIGKIPSEEAQKFVRRPECAVLELSQAILDAHGSSAQQKEKRHDAFVDFLRDSGVWQQMCESERRETAQDNDFAALGAALRAVCEGRCDHVSPALHCMLNAHAQSVLEQAAKGVLDDVDRQSDKRQLESGLTHLQCALLSLSRLDTLLTTAAEAIDPNAALTKQEDSDAAVNEPSVGRTAWRAVALARIFAEFARKLRRRWRLGNERCAAVLNVDLVDVFDRVCDVTCDALALLPVDHAHAPEALKTGVTAVIEIVAFCVSARKLQARLVSSEEWQPERVQASATRLRDGAVARLAALLSARTQEASPVAALLAPSGCDVAQVVTLADETGAVEMAVRIAASHVRSDLLKRVARRHRDDAAVLRQVLLAMLRDTRLHVALVTLDDTTAGTDTAGTDTAGTDTVDGITAGDTAGDSAGEQHWWRTVVTDFLEQQAQCDDAELRVTALSLWWPLVPTRAAEILHRLALETWQQTTLAEQERRLSLALLAALSPSLSRRIRRDLEHVRRQAELSGGNTESTFCAPLDHDEKSASIIS